MYRELQLQELVVEQPQEKTVTQDIREFMIEFLGTSRQMGATILVDNSSLQITSIKVTEKGAIKRIMRALNDTLEVLTSHEVDIDEAMPLALLVTSLIEQIKAFTKKDGSSKLN